MNLHAIQTKEGNIVTAKRGLILQQVNAQGAMGSGVAKDIRDKWPIVWTEYSKHIRPASETTPEIREGYMGKVLFVEVEPDLFVVNIVGQLNYGRDGKLYTSYDALSKGLAGTAVALRSLEEEMGPLEIHFPMLGCGLGGGDWEIVSRLIEGAFPTNVKTLWIKK